MTSATTAARNIQRYDLAVHRLTTRTVAGGARGPIVVLELCNARSNPEAPRRPRNPRRYEMAHRQAARLAAWGLLRLHPRAHGAAEWIREQFDRLAAAARQMRGLGQPPPPLGPRARPISAARQPRQPRQPRPAASPTVPADPDAEYQRLQARLALPLMFRPA